MIALGYDRVARKRQYVRACGAFAGNTVNMLPLELLTPQELTLEVAGRVKERRLHRGWTQRELARRSDITLATYRRFERTGRISLERLMQLAVVLDAVRGVHGLFRLPPAASLDEVERRERLRTRKRGRSQY